MINEGVGLLKSFENHVPAEMYRVFFERMEMVGHRTEGVDT
jgi:hypothetical protein